MKVHTVLFASGFSSNSENSERGSLAISLSESRTVGVPASEACDSFSAAGASPSSLASDFSASASTEEASPTSPGFFFTLALQGVRPRHVLSVGSRHSARRGLWIPCPSLLTAPPFQPQRCKSLYPFDCSKRACLLGRMGSSKSLSRTFNWTAASITPSSCCGCNVQALLKFFKRPSLHSRANSSASLRWRSFASCFLPLM
mmetsp:Transcript_61007/g.137635  ORF Transcript_61007/g.137635 Transcript_61007/m.137635 type:complete len:201 (-) Transcript_61007:332-934(-)